jgi:hypothetical protein
MRLEELLEVQQLDEINIGQRIGKMTGAVGKAVGNVKGAWQGAGDAYAHARNTAQAAQRANTSGGAPQRPSKVKPVAGGGASGRTAGTPGGAPVSTPGSSPVDSASSTPPESGGDTSKKIGPMSGPDIAKELGDVWSRATADQASATGAPQVRQQIIQMAKQIGMTGQTIPESKFYSKFLQMEI